MSMRSRLGCFLWLYGWFEYFDQTTSQEMDKVDCETKKAKSPTS